MSQTETLLLVVLGFALATLIALFLGRLVWVVALRLGARRMQKQVPSTLVGLQTERDRLRAEQAMVSQRLGTRLEAVKLKMAEQMAEVSRLRNRLEMADAELAARDATIEVLREHIRELEAGTANQAEANARLDANLVAREQELAEARAELDQLDDLATFGPEDDGARAGTRTRIERRIAKLNRLALHVATERAETEVPEAPAASGPSAGENAGPGEEAHDIQKELERLDAEWSKQVENPPETQDASTPARPRAVANVISLANRIRALQKDIGTP